MFCNRLKEFLRKNNVAFTDRDIAADESALADLQKIGILTTPVTLIDGEAVIGFDVPKLSERLGIAKA